MAETEDAVEGFDSCYVRLRAAFMISSQYSNNSNVMTGNAWKTATHGHTLQVLCQKLLTFTDTYVVITFKSEAQSNVLPVFLQSGSLRHFRFERYLRAIFNDKNRLL